MAAKKAEVLLKKAWREQWPADVWINEVSKEICQHMREQISEFQKSMTAGIIQYSISNLSKECQYQSYIKDSLVAELFSTSEILNKICQMDKSNALNQLDILLRIVDDSITSISKPQSENESMSLAVSLAKCASWLLGTIAAVLKLAFTNAKEETSNIQHHFDVCEKCFELFNLIMDTPGLKELALIGKVDIQGEQELILQTKLNDLVAQQRDTLGANQNISIQNILKQLMNCVARFLNSTLTSVMSQSRRPGHIPSHSLQTLAELQVIDNLYAESSVMADLFDFVLRSENIPMDQFYVDLMRCGYHGILTGANAQEELFWASFLFFKIPAIINCLRFKYQQSGLDDTIFYTACKQFAQMNILIDELDVYCKLRCLPKFLTKCQEKGLLDQAKIDTITNLLPPPGDSFESSVTSDRNPVSGVLNAARTVKDILLLFSSPWEENKEVLRQQLTQLTNSTELGVLLATAAGMDQLTKLVDQLVRLNNNTKQPVNETAEDVLFAEIRADIFNHTFVLLSYIVALFGVKILSTINSKDAFYINWRMNCCKDVGQKNFSPAALDIILEQVMASNVPIINAVLAKWDDYCLCAGAVIKELSQGLECGVIVVDKIQKVCETFKNKRPALCICASSWLYAQFNSMPAQKRDVTIKIVRAFRGHGNQRTTRSEFMAKIIEDLAGSLVLDQLSTIKGKSGKVDTGNRNTTESQHMTEILSKMIKFSGSPKIDKKSANELRKQMKLLSPAGFCKVFIKAILNSGKIDESKAFEVLCSTIILIDPVTLVPALLGEALPLMIKQSGSSSLLSDPQGSTLAKFISKSLAYALIHVKKTNASQDSQRPQKISKLDPDSDVENINREKIINSLVSLLEELLAALRWRHVGPVSLFLSSLLENIFICTMHLTPPLRLPEHLGHRLLKGLPAEVSNDILMLIMSTDEAEKRKELAHRICKKLQLAQT